MGGGAGAGGGGRRKKKEEENKLYQVMICNGWCRAGGDKGWCDQRILGVTMHEKDFN